MLDLIYCRVSTDEQAEDHKTSLQEQEYQCREYLDRLGYNNIKVFKEDHSGYEYNRPELDKIKNLIEQDKVRSLTVVRVDRLGRQPGHLDQFREGYLIRKNIEVYSVKDLGKWEWNPSHIYIQNTLVNFSQMWGKIIVQIMRDGKIGKVKNGNTMAHGHAPLGYTEIKTEDHAFFVIDDFETEIVKRIFQLYVEESLSLNSITRKFNEEGMPTYIQLRDDCWTRSNGKKSIWHPTTVRSILTNPTYKGKWLFNKTKSTKQLNGKYRKQKDTTESVAVDVPRLIDDETWDKAQERLAYNGRHRRGRRTQYPMLMTRRLTCGTCNLKMYQVGKHKGRYKYCRCPGSNKYSERYRPDCPRPNFRAELIDEVAWDWLYNLLDDRDELKSRIDNYIEEQEKLIKPHADRLKIIDKILQRKSKELDSMISSYLRLPELAQERVIGQMEQLENEIKDQEAEREEIEGEVRKLERTTISVRKFVDLYYQVGDPDSYNVPVDSDTLVSQQGDYLKTAATMQKVLNRYNNGDSESAWHPDLDMPKLTGLIRDDGKLTFEEKLQYIKDFDVQGTILVEDSRFMIRLTCKLGVSSLLHLYNRHPSDIQNVPYFLSFSDVLLLDFGRLPQFQHS